MKNPFRFKLAAVAAAAVAVTFSSCTYDPYYSSTGSYYSSGYGHGYGYGGSNFTTSFFVRTGDPRWGYDPYCHSYYDYHSHRYYDPYLYGYYPVGYRPSILAGVPHPYGWRPGRGYLPPPRRVRNTIVVNYNNREAAYRRSDYSWARQVRQREFSRDRNQYRSPDRGRYTHRQDPEPAPSFFRNRYNQPDSDSRSQDSRLNRRNWSRDYRRDDGQQTQPAFRERRDDPRRFTYNRQVITPSSQQLQPRRERFHNPDPSHPERARSSDQRQRIAPRNFQREERRQRSSDDDGGSRSTSDEPQRDGREERRIRGLGNG